jgi:hypothetical protein
LSRRIRIKDPPEQAVPEKPDDQVQNGAGHGFQSLVRSLLSNPKIITTIVSFVVGGALTGAVTTFFNTQDQIITHYPALRYWNMDKITDNSGALTVDVPHSWTVDKGERLGYRDTVYGPAILASSTDTAKWWSAYEESGMFLAVTKDDWFRSLKFEDIMKNVTNAPDYCSPETVDRDWYRPDRGYKVRYRVWNNCGEQGIRFLAFAAKPDDEQHVVVGLISIAHGADWKARREIFNSFHVETQKIPETQKVSEV